MEKKVKILDTTLREGEQTKNILFSKEEKIFIAKNLEKFGVDIIEVGHPAISEKEAQCCAAICQAVQIETLVHARAHVEEIAIAKKTGASWVGIWASANEVSLQTKYTNKNIDWVKEQVKNAVVFAKKIGLRVRFTIEDASRTPDFLLQELAKEALAAGADRLSFADTVGAWEPADCQRVIRWAVESFECEVEAHLHNDLGLALANAYAAIRSGASVIDVSVLGVGERAGICDLFSLSAYLVKFFPNSYQFDYSIAKKLAAYISTAGQFKIPPHAPIVGDNCFTHVSPYHAKAVGRNPLAYEFLSPEAFSAPRRISEKNYERPDANRFGNLDCQIHRPFVKGASELKYHRDGVGIRRVLMDSRLDGRTSLYVIERHFTENEEGALPHVDKHAHHCDSLFVFIGEDQGGQGLRARLYFNDVVRDLESPASVFIPAGVIHSYEYISGKGRYLNIVLSPDYNSSLL